MKCCGWSMALCGAETWTLRKLGGKNLESFEMWCWRRIEKISWTDRVKKGELDLLQTVEEESNFLNTTIRKKAN
jgi:hypothetical protein